MGSAPHISPKIRAYGKARIDITRRAQDEAEWRRLWKEPSQPYPFTPGEGWKFNVVYTVNDYAAEIGFLIDLLGFPVWAFSPSQAQLTSPDGGFTFTVLAAKEEEAGTSSEAVRLQLNVNDIKETVRELERRGVNFDQQPIPVHSGSSWHMASLRTPHGISIELWSEVAIEVTHSETENVVTDNVLEHSGEYNQGQLDKQAVDVDDVIDESKDAEQAEDGINEQEEKVQPNVSQSQLWHQLPGGVARLKTPLSGPARAENTGKGNGELTYDTLENDSLDGEDTDIEEDFP